MDTCTTRRAGFGALESTRTDATPERINQVSQSVNQSIDQSFERSIPRRATNLHTNLHTINQRTQHGWLVK